MLLGLALYYVGAVLCLNGLWLLGQIGDNEIAVIDIFVGGVTLLISLYTAFGPGADLGSGKGAALTLLFTFTYFWVAINRYNRADGRGLGWFCLFVAITAIPVTMQTLQGATTTWGVWFGLSWGAWGILWFMFFVLLVLKKPIGKLTGAVTVLQGILTGWLPGFLLHPKPETNSITLRDGRRLAYTEYGSSDGKTVLLCHGHPGSRLDTGIVGEEAIRQYGLRVIAAGRPGIGRSDFQPGRRIVDWPTDVAELADARGIEQFCVMGLSCGGPFAAATAHALPQRVTRLALVSSVGRFNIPEGTKGMGPALMYFRLARYAPWLSRRMVRMMGDGMKSNPQEMTRRVKSGLPPADVATMENPMAMEAFLLSLEEFFRPDPAGLAWEASLIMRPRGFQLEEISTPNPSST